MYSLSKTHAPKYLIRILDDYLRDRVLQYETENGIKQYSVTSGVPQGSVPGCRKYLFRFGIDESLLCPECPEMEEDPEHSIVLV